MSEMKWKPRRNVVILRAILKSETVAEQAEYALLKANAKDVEEGEEEAPLETASGKTEFDLYTNEGSNYIYNYDFFIFDKGEDVSYDLEVTDKVLFNFNNAKFIPDVTDPKDNDTFFYVLDQLVDLRAPGSVIIK